MPAACCSGVRSLFPVPRRCPMSYDHRTVGFSEYDSFLYFSDATDWLEEERGEYIITDYCAHNCHCTHISDEEVCPHMQRLRIAVFRDPISQEIMVAEEWLAVEDRDCDGTDVVKLAVYRLGHRPRLIKQVKPA